MGLIKEFLRKKKERDAEAMYQYILRRLAEEREKAGKNPLAADPMPVTVTYDEMVKPLRDRIESLQSSL